MLITIDTGRYVSPSELRRQFKPLPSDEFTAAPTTRVALPPSPKTPHAATPLTTPTSTAPAPKMQRVPLSPLLSPIFWIQIVFFGGACSALYWALYWAIATCVAWSLAAMGCTLLENWWNRSSFHFAAAGFLYYWVDFVRCTYIDEKKVVEYYPMFPHGPRF